MNSNNTVIKNLEKVRFCHFYLPSILLILIFTFLFYCQTFRNEGYVQSQKVLFLYGNSELSQYPNLIYNLTQLGDGLILLSIFAMLLIIVPKCWETFLTAFIVSAILSIVLKTLFGVQRPAAALTHEHFVIIGPRLDGHNSFPSGHSITAFTFLSVILFAFMPLQRIHKILWCFCICTIGALIISTRVGVGAHYPLDVTVGAIVGYLSAIIGILINRKYKMWCWIANAKFYPIFIAVFLVSAVVIILKILATNLIIFYIALLSLLITLFVITKIYVKKQF